MNEKKAMFLINILKNIINVYFDTFFVVYFLKVANYEVVPLAKYYLTLYLFIGIGFILIRNSMKQNVKVPYFRIGISLQAVYIALIMLLKEKIINYVYLVGIVKGIADGFYHFPNNILETEKITNDERQKYQGIVNIVNKIFSIIVPLLIGILLTYISYINLGKMFFVLFLLMFIISFYIDDEYHYINKKFELKKFIKLIKENKNIRNALVICLLSGLTYSSGVMGIIVTLIKINVFKTNLNIGFVDSACAAIYLILCLLYTAKIKKSYFKYLSLFSGFISFVTLIIFAFKPSVIILIIYLLVRNSFIGLINLITNNVSNNLSNSSNEIKDNYKAEYYLFKDLMYTISRCSGYLVLLIVCLAFGIDIVNYILIICGIALLLQGILVAKLCKNN